MSQVKEWKLVPVEPTEEMLAAGARIRTAAQRFEDPDCDDTLAPEYAAMLAASPQPPVLGGEPEVVGYVMPAQIEAMKEIGWMHASRDKGRTGLEVELIDRVHVAPLLAEIERYKELWMTASWNHRHAKQDLQTMTNKHTAVVIERDTLNALLLEARDGAL